MVVHKTMRRLSFGGAKQLNMGMSKRNVVWELVTKVESESSKMKLKLYIGIAKQRSKGWLKHNSV